MSNDIVFVCKTFFRGILFGIGFVAVVAAGVWFSAAVWDKPIAVKIVNPAGKADSGGKADSNYKSDLTVMSHLAYRERRSKNQLYVLGKIKNTGRVAWKAIEIQAEIFNKGTYVDECRTYIKMLMPGEEDNFKIICGDCAEDTIPDYDKIKLKVASAHGS